MTEQSGQTVVLTGAAGGTGHALDQPSHVQIAEMMILPVNHY
jgi:NADP-dependent 3-hydroxy acid dehydrogenase YdfG